MNEIAEKAIELIEARNFSQLKPLFAEMNPADIAAALEELPEEYRLLVFRMLPKDDAAETFVELDPDTQESLIARFTDRELEAVVDEMYLDDTVDMIEEMPANVVNRILKMADSTTRMRINEMLQYPKDSAGSIMTIEYVELTKNMTVEEAFRKIRATALDKETVYTCFVKDVNRKLVGMISVKDLLLADYETRIEDIMEKNVISVSTTDDKEMVAQMFDKYDFLAMPVVDKENRLVGIITVDDAMDVMIEETTEDIEKMAAIVPTDTDKSYMKTGVFEQWRKRIPWLMLLMVSATFTGKIITGFESALDKCVILTAFIPMLMDTGGNAGGQASVTIIRGLSLGEIQMRDILRVLWKELRVACLCGVSLGIANFAKMMLIDRASISGAGQDPIMVSLVVCLTLIVAVTAAKLVGCTLPIAAKRVGFDPAVMASPFITTIVDAISLLVYFSIGTLILGI